MLVTVGLQLSSTWVLGATPAACCVDVLEGEKPTSQRHLVTLGITPAQTTLALASGHDWLIEAREQGNDAIVEVRDSTGQLVAQADHPERRTGTRRMVIAARDSQSLALTVTGKEHAAATGTVEILVFDLGALSECGSCVRAYRSLAAADGDYALGQKISLGWIPAGTQTARGAYQRAAEEYLAAETLLGTPSDTLLRGQTALALAGLRYFDLQDWRGSAEWAGRAEELLAHRDLYRQARAEALAAAAWIEMATDSAPKAAVAGSGARSGSEPKQPLDNARRTLRRLFSFHMRRQERYDAALQMNNIGLAYYYGTQFTECIAAARSASAMFAQLHEAPRQGLAWQNSALCQWGLGHLPQALAAFNRALEDLRPEPYPQLYLLTLNNTALINFALGHLDESLRLHDRALELAIRTQNRREEAQSLYGIGVTYYALGDLAEAREFLERSLVIRSAALDGRGRRATLRSLATVYADRGEYSRAMELDREALSLAAAPISRAASRVQLAVHTALDGNSSQALQMLEELISSTDISDPLLRAEARLQRAVIERRSGIYDAALRDLALADPVLRRISSVPDRFSADLERARVLQLMGSSTGALTAVGDALRRSADIRRQTANPELRAQLQLPLRPAYDLQLDLLWEQFDAATKAGRESEATRIAALAFRSADAARAHSFADIAARQYSPAVRRDLAGDWARRERLYQSLAGLRFALDARLDRSGSTDPRVTQLNGEIAGLQREVDTLNNAIAARTASRGTAGITPVPDAIAQISDGAARSLPADAAIIAYWLGQQSAYCWTVTPEGMRWVRLTDAATLNETARAFHDALSRLGDLPREQRVKTAAALYAQIILPIEGWIATYRRWFFVPDGALDYVPFAALRGDTQADSANLIVSHDVALAPAAWMLLAPAHAARIATRTDRILLVSDPIYELSDPRLHPEHAPDTAGAPADAVVLNPDEDLASNPQYRRIPGTAREASGIEAQFRARDVDTLSGLQATRDRLLQLDWSQYRFIHIASHGHLDARMPQLSALILSSYDERGVRIADSLRAADLSSLTLNAEVAVFSGCDTALGKDVLNEGMVGISYATLARGAGAVVSSLWPVPDEIGANLMTEFYRHLLRGSTNPAAALSASMRSVLERNPSADPALWAAFQVSVVSVGESAHRQGRARLAATSTTDK